MERNDCRYIRYIIHYIRLGFNKEKPYFVVVFLFPLFRCFLFSLRWRFVFYFDRNKTMFYELLPVFLDFLKRLKKFCMVFLIK